jgi:hypothetical protein
MRIDARFNGPPDSANGGVTAGMLAAHLDAPVVEVTLRKPPPLDTDLTVTDGGLYAGDVLIAQAVLGSVEVEAPAPTELTHLGESALGPHPHPFPTCFVCATGPTDGLALLPHRVTADLVAVPWTPRPVEGLTPEVLTWAALDCPGGWSADLPGRPMVLGRMSVVLDVPPTYGEPHLLQGWLVGSEGRKVHTGSALYDAGGRVLAVAQATWITLT